MPFLETPFPEAISLTRFISTSGYCSYKTAIRLVAEGKVALNGKSAAEHWLPIHPKKDIVSVEGILIGQSISKKYFAFHKPVGLITSHSSYEGKISVYDFLAEKGLSIWVTSAGRLDVETSGLMILTNDTPFIKYLSHPETKVPKTYITKLEGNISEEKLSPLSKGIQLSDDEFCAPVRFSILSNSEQFTEIELTLMEGKKRQIRRMMKKLKLNLISLHRIKIGNCHIGDLQVGEFSEISKNEIINTEEKMTWH